MGVRSKHAGDVGVSVHNIACGFVVQLVAEVLYLFCGSFPGSLQNHLAIIIIFL